VLAEGRETVDLQKAILESYLLHLYIVYLTKMSTTALRRTEDMIVLDKLRTVCTLRVPVPSLNKGGGRR